jgi:hypothetical protein
MIEYIFKNSVGLCGSPLNASPNVIIFNGNTLDHRGLSRDREYLVKKGLNPQKEVKPGFKQNFE